MRRHVKICSSTGATPEKYGLRSSGKGSTLVQDDAVRPHRLAPTGVVRRDRRPPDANRSTRANACKGPIDGDFTTPAGAGYRFGRDTRADAGESAVATARWSCHPRRVRLLRGRAHRVSLPEHGGATIGFVAAELHPPRGSLRYAGEKLALVPARIVPAASPRWMAESFAARTDVVDLHNELC